VRGRHASRIRLPRHLSSKQLRNGQIAYYFELPPWARPKKEGRGKAAKLVPAERNGRPCPVSSEPLGTDLAAAIGKAEIRNAALDEWRDGVEASAVVGTAARLFADYRETDRFKRLKWKTRRDYVRVMGLLENAPLKSGGTLGKRKVAEIKARHADRLYLRLAEAHGARTARYAMQVASRCWNEWARDTGAPNPFSKMGISSAAKKGNRATTRAEYDLFRETARSIGLQSMATAAALMFELVRRATDVFGFEFGGEEATGAFYWENYRPGGADLFLVRQGKTGKVQEIPLRGDPDPDSQDPEVREKGPLLYPDLEDELARMPRGAPDRVVYGKPMTSIVISEGRYGTKGERYTEANAGDAFERIRSIAGLPEEMTLTGFRHGGATELGDAGVKDIRPVSGHSTRQSADIYNKVNQAKARTAAAQRRRHIEAQRDRRSQ
jgi:hypothetical protein